MGARAHLLPLFLAGQTCSGKSSIALELARHVGAEIISVDSMQVYRGMDIGTAKPSMAERSEIIHHLLDVAWLRSGFDAAQFCREAQAAVRLIERRGHPTIFCGGTGFYFSALVDGLSDAPKGDESLRTELASLPLEGLLKELRAKDPGAYESIDRSNPRRVMRAIEVIRLTGKPFSMQKRIRKEAFPYFCAAIRRQRDDLQSRIDRRVEWMFEAGLVRETQDLIDEGLKENSTACQAIGYKQVLEHLEGIRDLDETIDLVELRTRQYAKRQRTWFERQLSVSWFDVSPEEDPSQTADRIRGAWETVTSSGPR
jgi:tRNA dimethylallyltransferase